VAPLELWDLQIICALELLPAYQDLFNFRGLRSIVLVFSTAMDAHRILDGGTAYASLERTPVVFRRGVHGPTASSGQSALRTPGRDIYGIGMVIAVISYAADHAVITVIEEELPCRRNYGRCPKHMHDPTLDKHEVTGSVSTEPHLDPTRPPYHICHSRAVHPSAWIKEWKVSNNVSASARTWSSGSPTPKVSRLAEASKLQSNT
jgi:hypothetical protein